LKYLINYAINNCQYIAASNEGDAVATATGAYIAKRKSVVLFQNSGLTNATSPLTSLNYPFRIPILGFVSLRGERGLNDEPQHELMGQITTDMLDIMKIKWDYLSTDQRKASRQLEEADKYIKKDIPFFFIVKKGTFGEERLLDQKNIRRLNSLKIGKTKQDQLPSRSEALSVVNNIKDNKTVILLTTGKTGREFYEIEDSSNNLYMVGSLGCISSLGLGLAIAKNNIKVIIIDGDGSLLMRMGNLATNAHYNPPNMLHILLDNNSHDSTGGQLTASGHVDFISVASSCGYPRSVYTHNLTEFRSALEKWMLNQSLSFICMKIKKGSKGNLSRPKIRPHQVKERLINFINFRPAKK